MIALVSLMVPAALAQAELGSDPSSEARSTAGRLIPIPSAAALLDLKDSLLLAYHEQSLERQLGSASTELPKPIRNALRRAPAGAVAARASQPTGGYVPHSGADWYAIAMCESSGDWSANTGNGYYGGLQFSPSTWYGYGGGSFDPSAPFPYSAAEQIAVAERVLAAQGPGAWPNCFRWA